MKRTTRRVRATVIATSVLLGASLVPAVTLAAHASTLTPPTQGETPQASVGKGEGALNLIAWEGYAQPQWVKPFEKTTGCVVNVKYAGSSSEMVSLMNGGGGS